MTHGSESAADGACRSLIACLDRAVEAGECSAVCVCVKDALVGAIEQDARFLPEALLAPSPEGYARRLLHRDPAGRYSAVIMVWAPGQATPLHDHAGSWCVEAVYRGRIRVTSYDLEREENAHCAFRRAESILAGRGEAGALIPPFEYHTIENPFDETAVTIHVYRGELTACHVFEPDGTGLYVRREKALGYTDAAA